MIYIIALNNLVKSIPEIIILYNKSHKSYPKYLHCIFRKINHKHSKTEVDNHLWLELYLMNMINYYK
jgi:hypothetical protein